MNSPEYSAIMEIQTQVSGSPGRAKTPPISPQTPALCAGSRKFYVLGVVATILLFVCICLGKSLRVFFKTLGYAIYTLVVVSSHCHFHPPHRIHYYISLHP